MCSKNQFFDKINTIKKETQLDLHNLLLYYIPYSAKDYSYIHTGCPKKYLKLTSQNLEGL